MQRPRRKRRWISERKADRMTVGLAVFAAWSAGTLLTGELLRMARRRRESRDTATPANLVDAAGYATRDTLAVARLSTWGIRRGWWPAGNVRVSGRHIHHFIPGIVLAFSSGVGAITTRNDR